MKYFLDMKEEYSDVKNVNSNGNTFHIGDVYFGYVPEGFKYELMEDSATITVINLNNGKDYIRLQITKSKWSGQVNTEDTIIEELVIHNKDMVYYEKSEENNLSWKEENKVLVLSSNCEKNVLIDVAEGIEINKNISPQNQ